MGKKTIGILLIIAFLLLISNNNEDKKKECSYALDDCNYSCEDILFSEEEDSYTKFLNCESRCDVKFDSCME